MVLLPSDRSDGTNHKVETGLESTFLALKLLNLKIDVQLQQGLQQPIDCRLNATANEEA